ncbi:peptidoglycan-binding domain-containing protein [Streptomyces sp. NPDC051940]|uniref:peptidoglycan-binding domain-containing protein n=1 Tax=Streptomyces sp. NPDC051940 TaxID=3155675 RepID=UPI003428C009
MTGQDHAETYRDTRTPGRPAVDDPRTPGRPAVDDTRTPDRPAVDESEPDDVPAGPPRRRRHPVRTSLIALAAAAVAGAGGIAATGVLGGDGGGTPAAAPSGPARTTPVERTTLTRSETVDGTLGYGAASPVHAAGAGVDQPATGGGKDGDGAGAGGGTITWLPGEGDVIRRGEAVYSIDEDKVPLLYGTTPLYRTLDVGTEGGDVELLEKNLAALGYTGFTVDEEYTAGTADAVQAWQEDLGREETGKVAPGAAVVASGAKRVAEVKAARGTSASGEILTWTHTERLVTVDLEAQYEDLVKEGAKATVKLPNGTQADATVTRVGNAATAQPAASGGSGTTTLPVTLTVKDQKKLGRYQAAPVKVNLTAETRKNVLAVPVNALTARRGGGYAVQAVTASGVENRSVTLGLFANGMVEVSGAGITEGLKVGIPQ